MSTMKKIEEQMEKQMRILIKILQEIKARESIQEGTIQQETLTKILHEVQTQETMLKKTIQQVEQQQEMLNTIFQHVTGNYPRVPFKSPLSLLEKFDFDVEKLIKIAMYIADLYKNENEADADAEE